MMTSANLLKLAKQGDPHAIARLMNLTLEPKGVKVRAKLKDGCLYVLLNSTRALNRETLVSFTRRGIVSLGIDSIQTVKIYAQQSGRELPVWAEGFRLHDPQPSPTVTLPSTAQPPPESQPWLTQAAVAQPLPTAPPSSQSAPACSPLSVRLEQWFTAAKRYCSVPSSSFKSVTFWRPTSKLWVSNGYALASVAATVSFISGAIAAVITNATAENTPPMAASPTSLPTSSNPATSSGETAVPIAAAPTTAPTEMEQSIANQLIETKAYLLKMNQAQQEFYQQYGHFSDQLEELERRAAVISRSTHYQYRLSISEPSRSELMAIPKTEGLKSYIGIVSRSRTESDPPAIQSSLCESNPAPVEAVPGLPAGLPDLCPTNFSKVS